MTSDTLKILYQDQHLVAIDKPEGLLVHRSPIDKHEVRFAVQETRNQIGRHVYPVHRLDKPTSGVLLFALSPEVAAEVQKQFDDQTIIKEYLLVCRGYCPLTGTIDHPLVPKNDFKSKRGKSIPPKPAQKAVTLYERLATMEIEVEIDRYPTSRYSFVKAQPKTGRKHQIRRHFKHLSNPIIGCPKYGKSKHNNYFSEQLASRRLLLHCAKMALTHPVTGQTISITSELSGSFSSLISNAHWVYD